jgi:broad specificity phosphatase PhoE
MLVKRAIIAICLAQGLPLLFVGGFAPCRIRQDADLSIKNNINTSKFRNAARELEISQGNDDGGAESRRRKLLKKAAQVPLLFIQAAVSGVSVATANDEIAISTKPSKGGTQTLPTIIEPRGLDCLLDLPPRKEDCIRVYLCRHGQTENNRLRLVQGARVDAVINPTGEQQAVRLGKTLARLNGDLLKKNPEASIPTAYFHSQLQRAQQTAKAALQEVQESLTSAGLTTNPAFTIQPIRFLGEVDFGPIAEGKKVAEVRPDMARIYGAWSLGRIDERLSPGAESGREVTNRITETFEALQLAAMESPSKSVIAVSHGTFLRMLLATALDVSLLEASNFDMKNCAINVLDVSMTSKRTLKAGCRLLGGPISQVEKSFSVTFPEVTVVRKNEIRHLEGLL